MADQDSLFEIAGTARASDPPTSHEAAKANPVGRNTLRARVLQMLMRARIGQTNELDNRQRGFTDYEIAVLLDMPQLRGSVSKRRGELKDLGLVEFVMQPDGHTLLRPTDTGSMAIVWRLTDAGVELANQMKESA